MDNVFRSARKIIFHCNRIQKPLLYTFLEKKNKEACFTVLDVLKLTLLTHLNIPFPMFFISVLHKYQGHQHGPSIFKISVEAKKCTTSFFSFIIIVPSIDCYV